MNEAQISVSGYVAKQPVIRHMTDGKVKTEIRVGWTPRWVDKATGEWVDGITSYATVYCWRKLAAHVGICLRKGDPVLVRGRLTIRPYEKDGVRRESVEIEAISIGHDLTHGVATFSRVRPSAGMTAEEFLAAQKAALAAGQADDQPGDQPDSANGSYSVDDPGVPDSEPMEGEPLIDEGILPPIEELELRGEDDVVVGAGNDDVRGGEDDEVEVISGEKRAFGRARKERAALPA